MKNYFSSYFQDSSRIISSLSLFESKLIFISKEILMRINSGGCVYWFGNGGSASDAQHLAAELMGRFELNRRPIASIALNTDSSVLTALANDFGYSTVFARQIEGLVKKNDVVIGLTTSGKSENVILGLKAAKKIKALTLCLTGKYTDLVHDHSDHLISINTDRTCHIQESHIAIGQAICGYLESHISQ